MISNGERQKFGSMFFVETRTMLRFHWSSYLLGNEEKVVIQYLGGRNVKPLVIKALRWQLPRLAPHFTPAKLQLCSANS